MEASSRLVLLAASLALGGLAAGSPHYAAQPSPSLLVQLLSDPSTWDFLGNTTDWHVVLQRQVLPLVERAVPPRLRPHLHPPALGSEAFTGEQECPWCLKELQVGKQGGEWGMHTAAAAVVE
jgi:hypothetical protein